MIIKLYFYVLPLHHDTYELCERIAYSIFNINDI